MGRFIVQPALKLMSVKIVENEFWGCTRAGLNTKTFTKCVTSGVCEAVAVVSMQLLGNIATLCMTLLYHAVIGRRNATL